MLVSRLPLWFICLRDSIHVVAYWIWPSAILWLWDQQKWLWVSLGGAGKRMRHGPFPVLQKAPSSHSPASVSLRLASILTSNPIVFPGFELHINRVIQYIFLCVWLPSVDITTPRFLHIVACISTLFFFTAVSSSIVWIDHHVFIHSTACGWVFESFPFGPIIKK